MKLIWEGPNDIMNYAGEVLFSKNLTVTAMIVGHATQPDKFYVIDTSEGVIFIEFDTAQEAITWLNANEVVPMSVVTFLCGMGNKGKNVSA